MANKDPSGLGTFLFGELGTHPRTIEQLGSNRLANKDPCEWDPSVLERWGPLRICSKSQEPSRLANKDPSGLAKRGLLRVRLKFYDPSVLVKKDPMGLGTFLFGEALPPLSAFEKEDFSGLGSSRFGATMGLGTFLFGEALPL